MCHAVIQQHNLIVLEKYLSNASKIRGPLQIDSPTNHIKKVLLR